MIKVSNVVGINPKPFDPETYMEEDDFVTDESNGKKSVHKNVIHCRMAKNADGTKSVSPFFFGSKKMLSSLPLPKR